MSACKLIGLIWVRILVMLCFGFNAFGQAPSGKPYEVALSAGKIFFGTGDFAGYTIQVAGSKQLNKKRHVFLKRILLGTEMSFETGVKNPIIRNPIAEDFIRRTFYHASNTILNFKLSYYPLGGFAKGLHVSVGPNVGYTYSSHEAMATNVRLPNGSNYRSVMLQYSNAWVVGYKVSPGYDVYFAKKWLASVRIDFENFNNGDINTSYGIKTGVRF
jgi:acetyltransferase-like isoleucine patch superfamily enzyme